MARFYDSCVDVNISNIAVSGGETKEYSVEIMTIQFFPAVATSFDANARAK